ncbi:unnamed protein product [Rotaria sp. Silwood2]|nr:unnamed protein product [Rotaria sp. Silwood2]CAF2670361.1 unnamed protein product [Rotaria sp. Silwood2]CAF3134654.1 unnamed protein product [Rotaria sp. Silwood2]CAF4039761.1 unnamed protein product [Rotaria sp. Silwood2]CAF4113561.1 unnamed protein product [Rotaria sp. Silwood2]
MLGKIRCRIRTQPLANNCNIVPLSIALSKQQLVAHSLNESQNCAEALPYECTSSIIHGKQYPSLIAIDIDDNELPQEQTTFTYVKQPTDEESIRERRQKKRAKRSEEKKRKIEEKINKANQRWQKYSNIDYELVFFISRYYDQLPLCLNCRNYFTTHQVQFLADDPRASLDYAAEDVLRSSSNKTLTLKKAAKARLIKDYDKQTSIIFNLCDTCLTRCEQIRNELKQINYSQKMSNEFNSPNLNMMTMTTPDLQQQIIVPPSPNILNIDNYSYSPSNSPFVSPSTWNTDLNHQQKITSPSHQNTIADFNQLYVNNAIQYHQIKLQELYQQSQNIIIAQQYQENYPLTIDQQQLHHDLQSCIRQMQYHCLETLHLQYPGYSLSFPYTPSYSPKYLSYRCQEIDDESIDSENSSFISEKDNDNQRNVNIEDESDTSITTSSDNNRFCTDEYDGNQPSMDDRLTIETCHGLVEYYRKLINQNNLNKKRSSSND